ncbi:MAG TPA: hypothetical protein VKF37_20425 [Chloroflexota bacterium]|nr:hypothetical protein [Chloroflexota bacterium]
MVVVHAVVFVLGGALVVSAPFSALGTFVVPRGVPDRLTRLVFVAMRHVFDLSLRPERSAARERTMAFYAPVALLTLPVVWLSCLLVGYTAIFWALGASSWGVAFTISRLSLLYLGSDTRHLPAATVVAFSETVLSLLLAAILVSYLPTMYSAFSQREAAVTGLETRAGSPPSPVKMLIRYHRIQGMDHIGEVWPTWQAWFEVVEESHTALQPLVFYRSPQPGRSWVTAAGAVLDTAALVASTLERPRDPPAELCIRAGYLCLQRIARVFAIPFNPDPAPTDPISVTQAEFAAVCDALAGAGVPLKKDREQAWRDFAGWRVNYDAVLVALAVLTAAPPALWSSDRVPHRRSAFVPPTKRARDVALAITAGRRLT